MSNCTVSSDAEWAAATQQVASIGFLFVVVGTVVAAYATSAPAIEIPRFKISMQAYLPVVVLEAVVMGFISGYVLDLIPCLYSQCHRETGSDSVAPAVILISVWPVVTVGIGIARFMQYERFSLFHSDRPSSAMRPMVIAPSEPSAISAKMFAFTSADIKG